MPNNRTAYVTRIVKWVPPHDPWFKGNTDVVSRGNPGPTSFYFCIRNGEAYSVVAKGQRIKDTASLKTEAIAIRECLFYRNDNVIQHIIIQSDSWFMVKILQGNWEVPWSVTMVVNSIRALIYNISVRVIHSF